MFSLHRILWDAPRVNHTLLLSRQCTTQYQTLLVKEETKSIKRGGGCDANLGKLSANHNVIQTIINNDHYSLIWLIPRTGLSKKFYEGKVSFDHIRNPFLTQFFASKWLETAMQKKPTTTWPISECLAIMTLICLVRTIFIPYAGFINNK